jgi:hypothetical protein
MKGVARRLGISLKEYVEKVDAGLLRCDGGRRGEPHWAKKAEFKQNWSGRSRTCHECRSRKSYEGV